MLWDSLKRCKDRTAESGIGDLAPNASGMQCSGQSCACFGVFEFAEGSGEERKRGMDEPMSFGCVMLYKIFLPFFFFGEVLTIL